MKIYKIKTLDNVTIAYFLRKELAETYIEKNGGGYLTYEETYLEKEINDCCEKQNIENNYIPCKDCLNLRVNYPLKEYGCIDQDYKLFQTTRGKESHQGYTTMKQLYQNCKKGGKKYGYKY